MKIRAGKKENQSSLKMLLTLFAIGLLAGMLMWRYGAAVSFAYDTAPDDILHDRKVHDETIYDETIYDETIYDETIYDGNTTSYKTETVLNQTQEITKSPSFVCEAVVKSAGAVVNISRSKQSGEGNKYVCYYEENEEQLSLLFRIQQEYAMPQEKTTVVLKWKMINREGIHQTDILPDAAYKLQPEIKLTEFPVAPSPEPEGNEEIDYSLSQDEGMWYELTVPFTLEGLTAAEADGKTLIIAITPDDGADPQAIPGRGNAVPAEIRLVMQNQFDLD